MAKYVAGSNATLIKTASCVSHNIVGHGWDTVGHCRGNFSLLVTDIEGYKRQFARQRNFNAPLPQPLHSVPA